MRLVFVIFGFLASFCSLVSSFIHGTVHFLCVDFNFVCLFHLYPPVTRKRRWRYILDEFAPALALTSYH